MTKTLYLWDMAGTIFHEEWDVKETKYPSIEAWIEAQLGKKIKDVPDRKFEQMYEIPYKEGWYFQLALQPGAKEVLSWTKYNETFSTGMQEQMDWRAEYLVPKTGFDFRSCFQKLNSTFDYGETNKKTKEMLVDYLEKKYQQGYKTVIYTDDKETNCQFFLEAVKSVKDKYPDFSARLYHILNNNSGIKDKKTYWEIGSLYDFLANEKKVSN
ncbi:MAG: hypothetical protein WC675_01815 [Patescibacteria group bacterium]|jgi:hypothetical protein